MSNKIINNFKRQFLLWPISNCDRGETPLKCFCIFLKKYIKFIKKKLSSSSSMQGLDYGLLSMPLVWKQTKFLKLVCFWSSFCWKVYFLGISHKITMKRCLKPVFINVHLQKCVGANPLKNSHPHLFSNNWQLAEAVLTSFSINILKMWL